MIIKSIAQLKALSKDGLECHITLNGGLISRKYVFYDYRRKMFYIVNHIDGSEQQLDEDGLRVFSNIPQAIDKKALVAEY